MLKIIKSDKPLDEKISILNDWNRLRKKYNEVECIYGLDNKQFNGNYIKIGSTNHPENRKNDYQTYSPYSYTYLWVIYLEDFNCNLVDDLLKVELEKFNVKDVDKKNVGIEYYKLRDSIEVENILNKYKIKYALELGDKYNSNTDLLQVDKNKKTIDLMNDHSKLYELFKNLTTEQINYLTKFNKDEVITPEIDILKYKYNYVHNNLLKVKPKNINEIENMECQSINFFINKIKEEVRSIIILGFIQSGKTKEIIGLLYFCIRYLRIPVIILIQNKTSGYYQIEDRIKQFSKEINDYNIKCSYVKNGLSKKNSLKIFSHGNPVPQVFIALSNYKQLSKIKDNFDNITDIYKKKLAPYALIMDEYDDLIKSRQDDNEKIESKRIEKYSKFLQENSFINIGVTATLISCMLSEDKIKFKNIFHITPNKNYIGFGNKKIKVIDIEKYIINDKNKRELHYSVVRYLLQQIENGIYKNDVVNSNDDVNSNEDVNSNVKDYSITLINITDNKKKHKIIQNLIQNEFNDWAGVLFHSTDENKIFCNLPLPEYSHKEIIEGKYIISTTNKSYEINKNEIKIPLNHPMAEFCSKKDLSFYRYVIEYENFSISDVITDLLSYSSKICIISGRMACRGISFVSNDYKYHITDMIYVPSGSSHITRNVQDMRIYGNFPKNGLDINIYVDKSVYFKDIGNYIQNQNDIFSEYKEKDISLKKAISNYYFEENNVPKKKLDRIGLVKGFSFHPADKWGIPTNLKNFEDLIGLLNSKYPEYEIVNYSKFLRIDLSKINAKFKVPTKENKLSKTYKNIFTSNYHEEIEDLGKSFIDQEYKININNIWYVMPNYRNAWPLHNPLSFTIYREQIDLIYFSQENEEYIDIVLINRKMDYEYLRKLNGKKKIIIFYSKNSYHFTKCDTDNYYLVDKSVNAKTTFFHSYA